MVAGAAHAQDHPRDYANVRPIALPVADAIFQIELTQSVYEGLARGDRGDMRVFNGQDEVVPFAFAPRVTAAPAKPLVVRPPVFPLRGDAAATVEAFDLRLEQSGGRTSVRVVAPPAAAGTGTQVLGYLVDASAVDEPVRAFVFSGLAEGAIQRVQIDVSDDLRSWRPLVRDAPVASLRSGDASLVQDRIEVPAAMAKFYRIAGSAQIATITLEAGERAPEVARQWKRVPPGVVRESDGEYEFDLGGRFPADRMRLVLPQSNTVASVTLFSRARSRDPWKPAGGGIVYRMMRDGVELSSPDLRIGGSGDRLWMVRVDRRGGGIGGGVLLLEAGWVPDRVVFVARGAPPFQLAFGSFHAEPSSLTLERIVPGWRPGAPLRVPLAQFGTSVDVSDRTAGDAAPEPSVRAPKPLFDQRTWVLYTVLLLGLAVLGSMAFLLARKIERGRARKSE